MPTQQPPQPIDKQGVEGFLDRIPDVSEVLGSHSLLVMHFGYYLAEELGDDVTPKNIRACYDAAGVQAPANVTDVMRKSGMFVYTSSGTKLHREARNRIQGSLKFSGNRDEPAAAGPDGSRSEQARRVVVVHGRDLRLRDAMFGLLRSVGLAPVEWSEAVRKTGHGTPYTGEVVDALFSDARAIVVILSPDEFVTTRTDLQDPTSSENSGHQPRPNVFLEAGMALAKDQAHTILVQIGHIRGASDLFGRNSVMFDGTSAKRHELIERLKTAGCAASTAGSDWLRVGDFSLPAEMPVRPRRRRI